MFHTSAGALLFPQLELAVQLQHVVVQLIERRAGDVLPVAAIVLLGNKSEPVDLAAMALPQRHAREHGTALGFEFSVFGVVVESFLALLGGAELGDFRTGLLKGLGVSEVAGL